MNASTGIVERRRRPIPAAALFGVLILLAVSGAEGQITGLVYPPGAVAGAGDQNIEVIPVQGMRFPCLDRREDHAISYTDWSAGQFEVRGGSGRYVRIRIQVKGSATGNAGQIDIPNGVNSDPAGMSVDIGPRDVAISRDRGVTWVPINDSDLDFVTRFPNSGVGGVSSILVRIGARVEAESDQQRGQYCGQIRLTAGYTN